MGIVEGAFGIDSLSAILFPRSFPCGHHQSSPDAWCADRWGIWQFTRGHAQRRNEQAATRPRGVGAAVRGSPRDSAVGQLPIAPVPKSFKQMMFSAEHLQIRGMRRAGRIGNRMVDVTELGGLVAVGESASHVATPNELVQRRRRAVPRLGCGAIARMAQVPNAGATSNQLGQPGRGHRAAAGDERRGTLVRRGIGFRVGLQLSLPPSYPG